MSESPNRPRTIEAEIFSAGTWNGEPFTRDDLQEIAHNFDLLRADWLPPLKFGHDPEQTLLGQLDGDPALGWVDGLRVEGDKLVARFAGIPGIVHDAIREGRYRRVSAELFFDVRQAGRALGKALKAVALLGADLPAVTNLQELAAYLDSPGGSGAQPITAEARGFTLEVSEGRIAGPVEDPAPAGDAALSELRREVGELRTYKAREQARERDAAEARRRTGFDQARGEAGALTEAAVAAGKLPPVMRSRMLEELDAQLHQYSERRGLSVSLDWVREFIAAAPPVLPAGEVAHGPGADPAVGEEPPSQALARLASAKMVELNVSYGRAADYVLETHPGLARAYRDYTVNANLGG